MRWETVREYEDITFRRAEAIARIAINRPEVRNAFRPQTVTELIDAFGRVREDSAVGVVILILSVPMMRAPRETDAIAVEILDNHLRALQPSHLVDVPSSDQHTVKPWFNGKLAFVPPVKDFADEGFALIGGRLDVLGGQNVAALVYSRRKHVINVFVLPTKEPDTPIHPPGLRQGYQWRHWRHQGMEYCAVSDVSDSDLYELAQLLYQ